MEKILLSTDGTLKKYHLRSVGHRKNTPEHQIERGNAGLFSFKSIFSKRVYTGVSISEIPI